MQSVTRCPTCATKFKVLPEQLRASEGWVRCGRCNNVFDATDHFVEPAAPGEAAAPAPQPSARATEPGASAAPPAMPERPTERWLKDLSETFRPSVEAMDVEAMSETSSAASQSPLSSPDEQGGQPWLNHPDQPAKPESAAPISPEHGVFDGDWPAGRDLPEQAAPTPEPAPSDADAEPDAAAELSAQASVAVNAALLEAAAAASTFQQEVERWQAGQGQGHRASAHSAAEAAPDAVTDTADAPQAADGAAAGAPSGAVSAWFSVSASVPATGAALNPHAVQAQAMQPGAPSPASAAPAKEADVLAGAIVLAPAVHASAAPTPAPSGPSQRHAPDAQSAASPPAAAPAEPVPNSLFQTAAAPSRAALEEAAAREADEALRSQYHAQFSQTQELNFVRQAARDAFWRHPAVMAAQDAFYNRDSLAAYSPQMKTRMQAFCRLAGCQIAPLRALPALEIEGSTFQGHGDGVFTLFWSVRNRGIQSVRTPDLLLGLRDDAGQTRIRRVFPAAQLPSTPLEMAPGEQWQGTLHLRLADHAEAVTGYQLQIFYGNP
ncbi:MAG: DUF3426 domain-containing protein [Comamonadaceae bacterium]|nr:DUF3426 domain-containing protein [Comamonadaceae bacterium]